MFHNNPYYYTGCPKKNATPPKIVYIQIFGERIFWPSISCCRPNIFSQVCNISDNIFKWSLNYYISSKGTQKLLCTSVDVSVIYTNTITVWSIIKPLINQPDSLYKVHYIAVHVYEEQQTYNDPQTNSTFFIRTIKENNE